MPIKPTSDRKVRFYTSQYNTFGLLPGPPEDGGTCPGCTGNFGGCWNVPKGRKCHVCYVDGLMRARPAIHAILDYNTTLLRQSTRQEMLLLLDEEFTRFEAAEKKRSIRTDTVEQLYYRLHWSGDVFNYDYALALSEAMMLHPRVHFWTYTRSFESAPILLQASNLTLHLSLDEDNFERGIEKYCMLAGDSRDALHLCMMSKTPQYPAKYDGVFQRIRGEQHYPGSRFNTFAPCPVDCGSLPLENGCAKCRRCIFSNSTSAGVWFKA